MKKYIKLLLLSVLASGVVNAAPMRVALTFDDSLKDHYLWAAPFLEAYGWRGTFCIVTDWIEKNEKFMTWSEAKELLSRGHSIGNHTKSHQNLVKLIKEGKRDEARKELEAANEAILKNTGFTPVFMFSPGLRQNEETAKLCEEVGLKQTFRCRVNFGQGNEGMTRKIIEKHIASGKKCLDVLSHGISADGHGGWKPFRDLKAFKRHLDDLAALEKEGKIVIVDYATMFEGGE